jgi:hypothetical protein
MAARMPVLWRELLTIRVHQISLRRSASVRMFLLLEAMKYIYVGIVQTEARGSSLTT